MPTKWSYPTLILNLFMTCLINPWIHKRYRMGIIWPVTCSSCDRAPRDLLLVAWPVYHNSNVTPWLMCCCRVSLPAWSIWFPWVTTMTCRSTSGIGRSVIVDVIIDEESNPFTSMGTDLFLHSIFCYPFTKLLVIVTLWCVDTDSFAHAEIMACRHWQFCPCWHYGVDTDSFAHADIMV